MPVYEYGCQDCGERVTILLRSFSEAETSVPGCPTCAGQNLTRLISHVSIIVSERDRTKDLSWIDDNMANRFKKKAGGKLIPGVETS
jgi:putative FmdB family regulatory protein